MTSPDTLPTISEPALINQLEKEIKSETGIFSTSPSKKVAVTIDADLFGSVKVDSKRAADSDDDLFAPVASKPNPSKAASNDIFANGKPPQSLSQATATVSVFDSPPEDIFAPSLGSQQATGGQPDDIFASSKVTSGKKLDDLLGSPSRKGAQEKASAVKPSVEETDGIKVRVER